MTEAQQNIQKYQEVVGIIQATLEKAGIVKRYALSHQIIHDMATRGFLIDHHPEILEGKDPKPTTRLDVQYRGYRIYWDPKPIPESMVGYWSFVSDDYDGAPDSSDGRCGDAASVADAKAQIDEQIADAEWVPDEAVTT